MGRFREALAQPGLQAIAEVKRKSPSAGELRPDADPAALAKSFAEAGAAAVSVLVDERFAGSLDDLRAARAATDAPLIGKGFFSEEAQIRELAEAGADAFLLILRDLSDEQVQRLRAYGAELGLDALVEAHDAEELKRGLVLGADPIGVNCRNLSDFSIDRRRQLELVAKIPQSRVIVAESGIWSRAQGAAAELAGASAVLVGSALMRAPDPAAKLREQNSRPLV
ncbi:MAG: indole-3-glycerol-phosphate synthase [Gaiellaceae bacterium]